MARTKAVPVGRDYGRNPSRKLSRSDLIAAKVTTNSNMKRRTTSLAPEIVILERRGIFRGRQGATELARLLEQELPNAPYFYTNRLVDGRVAFLEWTAESEHARVRDGADSFVIENG